MWKYLGRKHWVAMKTAWQALLGQPFKFFSSTKETKARALFFLLSIFVITSSPEEIKVKSQKNYFKMIKMQFLTYCYWVLFQNSLICNSWKMIRVNCLIYFNLWIGKNDKSWKCFEKMLPFQSRLWFSTQKRTKGKKKLDIFCGLSSGLNL